MDITVGRIVICSLCVVSDAFSSIINPLPQNQAVLRGTRSAFNCTSDKTDWNYMAWSVVPVGEITVTYIYFNGQVQDIYKDVYEVSSAGPRTSMLTIKAVNESMAGTYIINDGVSSPYSVQLIVYNSDPVCTSNATSVSCLTPGQVVQMSCTFSYTASSSFVSVNMVWSKGSSSISSDPPSYSTSGILTTTAVSTIYEVVSYSSPFPAFRCQTSFRVTGSTGSSATNNPSYVNTTAIPEKKVCYFDTNCSIKGAKSDDSVIQGTSISCEANANPPPNYRWSNDGTGATLSTSSALQIWNDGQYSCTAWNEAGRCQLSISLTTYTTTLSPTTTVLNSLAPSANVTQSSGQDGPSARSRDVIIGVVVGVGGTILLVLLIVFLFYRIRKNRLGNTEQQSMGNKGEGQQNSAARQTKEAKETGIENIGAYEMLRNRSDEQPTIYCQLQPIESENSSANNSPAYDNLNQ